MDGDLRLRHGSAGDEAITRAPLSRPSSGRLALSSALVIAAVALAACGKGGATTTIVAGTRTSSTGTSATATTPAPPSQSAPEPSAARARAFARAVNLTAGDVRGFTPTDKRSGGSASEHHLERQMLSCAGLGGASKAVVEEGSKSFQLKRSVIQLSVSSEVTVEPSSAAAQRALSAIRSAHVRGCFSRFLEQLFHAEHVNGATAGPVTIQAGTPPAPGTSGSFGWRVTASFQVRGIKVPLYLDILGFVEGPSEVTLLSSSVLRPFPAEAQQHLFTVLLARARANRL
ncbi:MAG: hypothetical protein JWM66_385 [Solirubrobacterales bacterium]|nr:hypothetical protein [Solirubrobacterales bacterium]